jgi:2-polyprenyl-6-methoxyphenol hydroxylase-like FAD-dependent oxidoreductase
MAGKPPSVLLVGAGPTGLTAAIEVVRRGIAPRIVDDKTGPTPLSKAVGVSTHSLDILEPSKVAERLLAAGLKIQRAHFHFESRELGVIDFSILPHRYNFLWSLPPNGGFRDPMAQWQSTQLRPRI